MLQLFSRSLQRRPCCMAWRVARGAATGAVRLRDGASSQPHSSPLKHSQSPQLVSTDFHFPELVLAHVLELLFCLAHTYVLFTAYKNIRIIVARFMYEFKIDHDQMPPTQHVPMLVVSSSPASLLAICAAASGAARPVHSPASASLFPP
eukprot:626712-Pleurochrysis_carterae.AAC.1